MAQGTRTENTAVNRLIEMAHERPLDADDALFSPPSKKTLPPPFPRTRAPHSTQTQLAPAPPAIAKPVVARPAPTEHDAVTRPFDPVDVDIEVDDDADPDHTPLP